MILFLSDAHRKACCFIFPNASHGVRGVSYARLVPSLKDLVGYYLWIPEGHAYLPRLPNVAFSTLTDEKLAWAPSVVSTYNVLQTLRHRVAQSL
jgi:hypothetical protein